MPSIKYPDELVQRAITICKDYGFVEKWQPVLFAGIHLYEQGCWQEAFPFLEAATLRGNLIAYGYLQAMVSQCSEQLTQFKAQHRLTYQRYESLENFPSIYTIGKDWVQASNTYRSIMALRQQKASNSQAKKLKRFEQSLLSQCGNRAESQRANELYWRLNPSKLDSKLASYLQKSCSVQYRNYLVNQDKTVPLSQKKIYLGQLLTLFRAINGDNDSDGIHVFQCAEGLSPSVEKKNWHIIAAHLGDANACMILSLQQESEQSVPFWIYRGATLGEHRLIRRIIEELSSSSSDYGAIKQEFEFWCREHIQTATAPLDERFTSSLILAETLLNFPHAPSINTLHSLRELLEDWQISLEALSEHPYILRYHELLCKNYILIDCAQPEARWVQQALHHASKGLSEVQNEFLLALYQYWCDKRPNIVFDEALMERISQQLQDNQYAPFLCAKEVQDLARYLEGTLEFSEHPIDYQYLKRVLDTLVQYHQQGVNLEVAALGILRIFSSIDVRQLHSEPMQFMQPYLLQLDIQIQNLPPLQVLMHAVHIRYGDAPKRHLAQMKRLYAENCQWSLPMIGHILEKGVPGTLEPQPKKAARFYKKCLIKKLSSQDRFFCLNELGKLYLNYVAVGIEKHEAIAYLMECNQQDGEAIYVYNLGRVYAADEDTLLQALPLYEKAALMGDVDAMYNLGTLYANKDIADVYKPQQAFQWLLQSLAAGNLGSAYNIGVMLLNDAQIRCPETSDFKDWHFLDFMALAAPQDANAQYFLAVLYLCHGSTDSEPELLYCQGQFYLNQAKEHGLLLEMQHVENMLDMIGEPTLPLSLLPDLLCRDFQSAWEKLGLAQPYNKVTPNSEAKSATPLERCQQKTCLLPQRLQKSIEAFLSQRKLTANDFIQLLKKFCHAGKGSLNESAAGSRITFTQGELRFTFHPPHNRSKTLDENRRHDYQDIVKKALH